MDFHSLALPVGGITTDVSWLNAIVATLWPGIDVWFEKYLKETLTSSIDDALPSIFKGAVQISCSNLGKAEVRFGPLTLREREGQHGDSVVLDIGIDLQSPAHLDIHVKPLSVMSALDLGIKGFSISGVLSVVARPIVNEPPFFGGLEIYCINPPEIRYNFTGAAAESSTKTWIAQGIDYFDIRSVIRSTVNESVSGWLVVPSRYVIDMIDGDDTEQADFQYPDPAGVLRLTLLSAEGLCAAAGVPDPYVTVILGGNVWTSPVALQTSAPEWKQRSVCPKALSPESQEHLLEASKDASAWKCDVCSGDSERSMMTRYGCKSKDCDFDVCGICLGKRRMTNQVDLLVYERGQHAQLSVYDGNLKNGSDSLGEVRPHLNVDDLVKRAQDGGGSATLALTAQVGNVDTAVDVGSLTAAVTAAVGTVTLRAQWLSLSNNCVEFAPKSRVPPAVEDGKDAAASVLSGPSQLFIAARILDATGVPATSTPPYTVRVRVSDSFGESVVAEYVTNESEKQDASDTVGEEIQQIVNNLSAMKMPIEQIAKVVSLDPALVGEIIAAQLDSKEAEQLLRRVKRGRPSTHQVFDEVVQILLPWDNEMLCKLLTLELLDGKGVPVGSCAKIAMDRVVPSSTMGGVMAVRVLGCKNLMNVDSGLMGDVSDPYVVLRLGNAEFRTATVKNNLNPKWESSEYFFAARKEDLALEMEVWDANRMHDDVSLGTMKVDVNRLTTGTWTRIGDKLKDGKGGELIVDVHWSKGRDPAKATEDIEINGPFRLPQGRTRTGQPGSPEECISIRGSLRAKWLRAE